MLNTALLWENATSVSGLILIFTIIALIVSTKYTFSTIGRIWNAGDPRRVADDRDRGGQDGDSEDCDGDDEAEDDDEPQKGQGDFIDANIDGLSGRDPVEYCEHIQGEVKRVRQKVTTKKIEEGLTEEQIKEERQIQREQLEQIYKLMEGQSDRFGVNSFDDVKKQMTLYG